TIARLMMVATNMMKKIPIMFAPFADKMRAEGLPSIVIETFNHYYKKLLEGETGFIKESDIYPVEALPDMGSFNGNVADTGRAAISKTVLIKLNGGLGTSMGLAKPKSLIKVKQELSFLDIIARHAIHHGTPLIFMNSFVTREDTLEILKQYPRLWENDIGIDFVQHKVPKINQADFTPALWPQAPHMEWCPPGHGDIYTALQTSGMLERLLVAGYEYAFVSNVDNLGAVLNLSILGYFSQQQISFMMEVTDRTEADKKGGHLAQLVNGQLILRESAQCPAADIASFEDVSRHKYFNTNNLWINLVALKSIMAANNNILGLSLIRNAKTLDPRNIQSPPVYHLETAMGSAISVFENAQALRVPRHRFSPVKTTNDLLLVRSDAYLLTDDYLVVPDPARQGDFPVVELDTRHYKFIDDFEARFPAGIPSLSSCSGMSVKGDIKFAGNITLIGDVHLDNNSGSQVNITANSVINGSQRWR
ncbi:MAG: UTP--glucose-1-phosphate uridylyltransferase, partial [Gammaproteobacteria bacterium]|nr:UTP--glucose-1-phosphate uridylyltransferase [Gammaproteobacteria bacterium]